MTITISISREAFPEFRQPNENIRGSDSSQPTSMTVQTRNSTNSPNFGFTEFPKPAFGVSIIKTDSPSVASPRSPSFIDKYMPPTPFMETFEDEGQISPDYDRLLDDDNIEDVEVSSELPSKAMLDEAAGLPIIDAEGKEMLFKNLYTPSYPLEKKRVMVIFVRHFFCGNCQEYLRSLTSVIPSPAVLPDGTELVIIGCGSPSLINMYIEETTCPFPVYADPTKRLYNTLGMGRTLNLGRNDPEYIRRSLITGMFQSVVQGVKRLAEGDAFRGGDMRQIGGEFIFEANLNHTHGMANTTNGNSSDVDVKVTWCHRMRNTRDHAEIKVICRVLGLSRESEINTSEKQKSTFGGEQKLRRPQRVRRWTTSLANAMTVTHGHKHSWNRVSKSIDAGRAGIFGKFSKDA